MVNAILGFDVGNSYIKAGWFDDGSVTGIRGARHQSSEMIEEFVDGSLMGRPLPTAVIATVNKAASDRLVDTLAARSVVVARVFESDGSLFDEGVMKCGVDTPKTTGVDRILSCIAARRKTPSGHVVVVTCGTAITVNLASSENVFEGGAILPGIELMARSLHEGTSALPRITCPPPPELLGPSEERSIPPLPGRSTISAMRAGVYFAAVAAIDRLVDEIEGTGIGPAALHITGGDASLLMERLRRPFRYSPYLVLEGLAAVAADLKLP